MTATCICLWINCGDSYSREGISDNRRDSENPSLVPGDVRVTDEHLCSDSRPHDRQGMRISPLPPDYWTSSLDANATSSTATGPPHTEGRRSSELDTVNSKETSTVGGNEGYTLGSKQEGRRASSLDKIQGDRPTRILGMDEDQWDTATMMIINCDEMIASLCYGETVGFDSRPDSRLTITSAATEYLTASDCSCEVKMDKTPEHGPKEAEEGGGLPGNCQPLSPNGESIAYGVMDGRQKLECQPTEIRLVVTC